MLAKMCTCYKLQICGRIVINPSGFVRLLSHIYWFVINFYNFTNICQDFDRSFDKSSEIYQLFGNDLWLILSICQDLSQILTNGQIYQNPSQNVTGFVRINHNIRQNPTIAHHKGE